MSEDKYVLVVERDTVAPSDYDRPLVLEQHVDDHFGTLEDVKAFQKRLDGKYGKTRIARLEFMGDWE